MTQFGFGRERRLRRRSDFVRVQGSARRVTTRHYLFLVSVQPREIASDPSDANPSASGEPEKRRARLGIVVTRKLGNAVARNRIKRVCRECFRHWPDLLPDGIDLVIVARQGADRLGLSEARAEWSEVSRVLRKRAEEALAARATLAQRPSMPHVSRGPKPAP